LEYQNENLAGKKIFIDVLSFKKICEKINLNEIYKLIEGELIWEF
jgi:hypothetical protein